MFFACAQWLQEVFPDDLPCMSGPSARGSVMFFARKKVYETVTASTMLLIAVGVFVLLNQHIPIWAAAMAAGAVLVASIWSGP